MTLSFIVGWRQVGAALVLLAGIAMIAATYGILAAPLAREFHPPRMVLMLAMTTLSGASALLAPWLGARMDQRPLRRMMVLGVLLLASGYAALSFTTAFWQVLVVFALFMAPANILLGPVAATVLLSRWFVRRRGLAIGIAVIGIALGSVVYAPLVSWFVEQHPWRQGVRLLALVLLAVNLPAALLIVDHPAERGLGPDGDQPARAPATPQEAAAARAAPPPAVPLGEILRNPAFWLLALMVSVVLAGAKGMITNIAPAAIDVGIAPARAALLISIYGLSGMVAKISFAALADRFAPRALLVAALAGFAAGMACETQAQLGFGMMATGIALLGVFGGLMVPMQSLLAPRLFGERIVGRAMGLLSAVTAVALLATPPLFGAIYDLTGSYRAIFAAFAALALATLMAASRIDLAPARQPAAGAS